MLSANNLENQTPDQELEEDPPSALSILYLGPCRIFPWKLSNSFNWKTLPSKYLKDKMESLIHKQRVFEIQTPEQHQPLPNLQSLAITQRLNNPRGHTSVLLYLRDAGIILVEKL